jgi:hypothetical protein
MLKKIMKLPKKSFRLFAVITVLLVVYASSGASYPCEDFRTKYGKNCLKKVEQGHCSIPGIKCVDAADKFLECCKNAKLCEIPACWKNNDPCETTQCLKSAK